MHWETLQINLAQSNHVRCETGWQLDATWSQRLPDYDLWLVWAGRGQMQLRSGMVDLYPGMCLWMRPGGQYIATQDEQDRLGVSAQHFELTHHKTGKRLPDAQLPPETIHIADIQAMVGLMRRIAHLHHLAQSTSEPIANQAKETSQTLMRGLLMELACTAAMPPLHLSPSDHLHRSVITQMAADMAASPHEATSIKQLADNAGYSPAHFSRIFKQIMGTSPQHYLMEARINRARQLLQETDWSITRIAEVMGYRDVYFFSRQFKHVTGLPPSSVRQS
jgi:AraC-like DNA-binding protein